jgi:hypothetical protein
LCGDSDWHASVCWGLKGFDPAIEREPLGESLQDMATGHGFPVAHSVAEGAHFGAKAIARRWLV